jgi:hypothetical protein
MIRAHTLQILGIEQGSNQDRWKLLLEVSWLQSQA